MCDIKKLCSCDEVGPSVDHWKLECHYGLWPSWDQLVETRPEHRKLAEDARMKGKDIMGPLPMPLFKELHRGIAGRGHLMRVISAEEDWLNEGNQFDFEYQPFEGDRLMFFIGREEIAFSFQKGKWRHKPHQAYSADYRMGINAEKEDLEARARAAVHLESRYGSNG